MSVVLRVSETFNDSGSLKTIIGIKIALIWYGCLSGNLD